MLFCMRTTLNLDDHLMRKLKKHAAETGQTITHLIEQALRDHLNQSETSAKKPFRLEWITVSGRKVAGIDISDRDALYNFMDRDP